MMNGMCTPQIDPFYKVLSAPNRDHMKKLHPREVDVSTYHIGAHKPFCISSSVVRVFDV
jgi:hypothetical protein